MRNFWYFEIGLLFDEAMMHVRRYLGSVFSSNIQLPLADTTYIVHDKDIAAAMIRIHYAELSEASQ